MERLGEYLLHRMIGEGGMGKVFEAEERLSKRRVALKILHADLANSEHLRALFINEMAVLSHLDHPHIVRCLHCAEIDGQLVMALEFLQGKTLRQLLHEEGPLAWERAIHIAMQIVQGLAAAHEQKPPIIHRDLKPENIMILANQTVKIMDFGIAKVLQSLQKRTTQTVGTLQYMSPEQIDAEALDARSDYYNLGIILYEMLAGKPPFDSPSPRELLNQQCFEPPPPLPDEIRSRLPKGIEKLMERLLAKKAEDRPRSSQELLAALEVFAPPIGTINLPKSEQTSESAANPAIKTSNSIAHMANTLQLIERAHESSDISLPKAALIFLSFCTVAGFTTYIVRMWISS